MTYRTELPDDMPARIAKLPVYRGYPVPWFVVWLDERGRAVPAGEGMPEFRIIKPGGVKQAVEGDKCWVCGKRIGLGILGASGAPLSRRAFVLGPMCAVNRTSAEPPCHPDCADWSARACPFLTRPHARRRPAGLGEVEDAPGIAIKRNPGVALVWHTTRYKLRNVPNGTLFDVGTPEKVSWYCEGRDATREEVLRSIETGLPLLREACEVDGPAAHAALDEQVKRAMPLLPEAA